MIKPITDTTELAQVAGGFSLEDLRDRFGDGSTEDFEFGSGSAVGDITSIDFTTTTEGNRTTIIGIVEASSGS